MKTIMYIGRIALWKLKFCKTEGAPKIFLTFPLVLRIFGSGEVRLYFPSPVGLSLTTVL